MKCHSFWATLELPPLSRSGTASAYGNSVCTNVCAYMRVCVRANALVCGRNGLSEFLVCIKERAKEERLTHIQMHAHIHTHIQDGKKSGITDAHFTRTNRQKTSLHNPLSQGNEHMGMYACFWALLLRAFVQMHIQTKWNYVPVCRHSNL